MGPQWDRRSFLQALCDGCCDGGASGLVGVREHVAAGVQGGACRCVAHPGLHRLDVGARADEQRREVVPQVVVSERLDSGSPSTFTRASRMARSMTHGAPPATIISPPNSATDADRSNVSSRGIGMGAALPSVLSGLSGHCRSGVTTPRVKSTSVVRSAAASDTRSPANAPSSTATRSAAGIASCNAHTCAVVATYTLGLPIGGDVLRLHGLRPKRPSWTASARTCESRECSA